MDSIKYLKDFKAVKNNEFKQVIGKVIKYKKIFRKLIYN